MAAEGLEDVLDDGIEILEESVEDKETHRVLGRELTYPKKSPCPKRMFLGWEQLGEQRLLKSFRSEWRKRHSNFEKKLFGY